MSTIFQNLVLENNRVLLKKLSIEDIPHLVRFAIEQPHLWDFSLVPINDESSLFKYVESAIGDAESNKAFPFIILDKEANSYAGSTRFYDINFDYKMITIGYTWIGDEFQGTGLNKNMKYLLLEYAFEVLNMERVEFRADANNTKSLEAMKSIGCTLEGILRSHMPTRQGGRRDSAVLSIVKSEWLKDIKSNLRARI
ncbi:MAG: GNAT family N-acetyltransferase [Leadbetterella sp.]